MIWGFLRCQRCRGAGTSPKPEMGAMMNSIILRMNKVYLYKYLRIRVKKAITQIPRAVLLLLHAFLDPFVLIALLIGIPLGIWIHTKYLYYLSNFPDSPLVDILVEAHGLVFDVLFFSIVLGVYTFFIERRRKIQRYEEEIDDYRGWEKKEAMHRISGSIRRLNKERKSARALYRCYLKGANLMGANLEGTKASFVNFKEADLKFVNFKYAGLSDANLNGSILMGADLSDAELVEADLQNADLGMAKLYRSDLRGANFQHADLREANLEKANLAHANLEGSNLTGVIFKGADLSNTNLHGAKVDSLEWIKSLNEANVRGVIGIEEQYLIVPIKNQEKYLVKKKKTK